MLIPMLILGTLVGSSLMRRRVQSGQLRNGPHSVGDEWWVNGVDLSLVSLPFPNGHVGSLYGNVQYRQWGLPDPGPRPIAAVVTSTTGPGEWWTCSFAIGYGGFGDPVNHPELVGCAEQAGGHSGVGNDPGAQPEEFVGELPTQPGIPATQFIRRAPYRSGRRRPRARVISRR